MRCHVCNAEVGEGQRFCHECGQSLTGVTDSTQELERLSPDALAAEEADRGDVDPADAGVGDDDAGVDEVAVAAAAGAIASGGVEASHDDGESADDGESNDGDRPDDGDVDTDDDVGSSDDDSSAGDFAPPVAEAIVGGAIGASLFDPEKAPPVAEPDWGDPIPKLSAESFDDGTPPADLAATSTAAVAATAVAAQEPAAPFDADAALTREQPVHSVVYDADADSGVPERLLEGEIQPFRIRPAFVLSFLGMIAMLMATIADITDIRTDRVVAGIDNRLTTIDDIGSNLAVAGYIGAAVMLVGGLMQCFHFRWGAGMAGGAGLAIVGWAALTIGLAEVPISAAERITRSPTTPGPFTLTVTRDLGYWLIVALAGVGLVVFLFSLTSAGTGGRRGLNPWTAALGAVGALVVAAGPLITVGGADFSVNFGTDNLPAAFFAGRLVQLALIAVTGVVGFLLVRAYGLGLVGGGISVAFWLWLSSLLELGDRPLGIAAGNLGSSDTTPHAVTTVGIAVTVLMLVVSATIAIVGRRR